MNIAVRILLSFALACGLLHAKSQEFYDPAFPLTTESNTLNRKISGTQYYFYSTLRGSVYLNDDWKMGSVVLENGDRFDNIYLKINTLTHDLITLNERIGTIIAIDKFTVDEFIFDVGTSSEMLFRKINSAVSPRGDNYFHVLYENKIKLLCWYDTFEQSTSTYHDDSGYRRSTHFVQRQIFFLVFPDNQFVRISGSRRSLIRLFPEEKRRVRRLLRQNRVNLNQESQRELSRAIELIEEEFFAD